MRRLTRWFVLFCAVWVVSGCNCDPSEVGGVSELIAVPKNASFNAQEGQVQTKKVLIQAKVGVVQITSIKLVEGAPHYELVKASVPEMPKELSEGESFALEVKYKAPSGEAPAGLIQIDSDAATPKDGILKVRLLAQINQQYLVFTPDPVDFKQVKRGESKEIEVVGENRGRALIKITEIKWDDRTSKAFEVLGGLPKVPVELKPGEVLKFKVKYAPTTAKIDERSLLFTCDGGCAPASPDPSRRKDPLELKLIGQLAAPLIEVKPQKIDFGYVDAGSEKTEKLSISNKGSAPLQISKISTKAKSSGAFVVARLVDVVIPPGESKELPVIFRPASGIKHEGVIEIHNNDPSRPLVEVQLLGQVSAPDIEVAPKVLNFGSIQTPKELAFTISNTGSRPLEITSISMFPGTSPEFRLNSPNVTFPLTLNPNQFQAIKVLYTPANKGDDTGKVSIVSNDPDENPFFVELKATGSLAPACDLTGAPTKVNFGTAVLGKSKIIEVTWTNRGSADCLISSFAVSTDRAGFPPYSGPEVFHLPSPPTGCKAASGNYVCNPPVVVKPNNNLKMNVGFTPITEKKSTPLSSPVFTGFLDAAVNANPTTRRITLEGLGKEPCLVLSPDTVDFGLVKIGCSSKKETLSLYNICSQAVTITKIDFALGKGNGFRITQAPKLPLTLGASQSIAIEVAFRPTSPPQKQNGVLSIESNVAHQSPMTAPLIGEGTNSAEQTDTFKQAQGGKVDILFVIDNSGSMGNDQQNLSQNLSSFIQWASRLQVDFQIGVTTTSVKSNPIAQVRAGEFVGTILTPQSPNLISAFAQQTRVGTTGSGTEQGLDAMKIALSPPLITTGKNKGFLRQGASLSIVTVSDEQDSSNLPVQAYINFLNQLKGFRNRDLIRYNIVIGIDEKTLKSPCPGGRAASSGRYLAVAQAFRGVVASICNANWSQTLSRIGSVTFGLKSQFFLSRAADDKTIQVTVDGKVVATGANTWTYSSTDNSITFKTPPKQGSTIQVRYTAICFP